jgi:hypothetical protein
MATPFPTCPRCGCPARVAVITKARVRCLLNGDGGIGEMISASRGSSSVTAYECAGGHVFTTEPTEVAK